MQNKWWSRYLIIFLLMVSLGEFVSCTRSSPEEVETEETEADESEHLDGHEHGEDEHIHEAADRIPNDGAVIHIIAPANEATFSSEDDISIIVE